jgi:hypothetical protein
MFSAILVKEKDYPEFVSESHRNFQLVIKIIEINQSFGVLRNGSADFLALSAWGSIHGFVMLLLEGQIPRAILNKESLRGLLEFQLKQIMLDR